MGDDNGAGIIFCIGVLSGAMLTAVITFHLLDARTLHWKIEAVKHNAARLETATDGSTAFKWNEEPTDE